MASINLQQLEAAFRYKIKYKTVPSYPLGGGYVINFEGKEGVFEQARKRILPSYLTKFPDNEEGHLQMAEEVIKSLDKQRTGLESYFKPVSQPTGGLPNRQTIPSEQTVAANTATGESAATMTTGAPTQSYRPPVIHNIPQAPVPSGTGQAPSLNPTPAKLAEQLKTNVSPSQSSLRTPKVPTPLVNTAKNFGSRAGIFTKVNLGRLGRGLGSAAKTGLETLNPFLGQTGNKLVGGLTNIANPMGMGGAGSRSIFGRFSKFGRGGGGRASSLSQIGKKRSGLIFAISLIGFMLLVGGIAAFAPPPTPGGTTPLPSSPPSSSTQPLTSVVYYCQHDSRWASTSYACETISRSGCGPTSLAMVLSSFGSNYNPAQAAQLLTSNNYAVCMNGTAMESVLQNNNFLSSIGLTSGPGLTNGGRLDLQAAKGYIDRKFLIVGSSDAFPLCNCGHIFVVQDVNPDTQIVTIRDPNNCSSNGVERTTGQQYSANAFTWKYAYPVTNK